MQSAVGLCEDCCLMLHAKVSEHLYQMYLRSYVRTSPLFAVIRGYSWAQRHLLEEVALPENVN